MILTALKTYGMIVADNGSPWFMSGVPDERWNNDMLHVLGQLHGSDFEVVDTSTLMVDGELWSYSRSMMVPVPRPPPQHMITRP